MGLFQTTRVVLMPVVVVTSNPIGGIIMIILAFVFWKIIFTVVAAIIAIALLIGLLGWWNELSDDFSAGAKIIGYLVIIGLVAGGYAVVHQKINGDDLSKKEAEALDGRNLIKDANEVQNESEPDSKPEKTETSESTVTNETSVSESEEKTVETKESTREEMKTEENSSNKTAVSGVVTATNSEGFYSDGVNYYYKYNDTLYQANDIVFKPNSKAPEKLNFYYFVGQEIVEKTVVYDGEGKVVKNINDSIIKHDKITEDPRFYAASAVLLFGVSLVAFSLLKGRSKRGGRTDTADIISKEKAPDKVPATEVVKAAVDPNRVRSKVVKEDGYLTIEFEPAISKNQVEQLRQFVNGLPKNNHKKIRINGEGLNIRALDDKEVKLTIDFLESMSIYTKNKSKFYS
jgi:hypothetical protein